MLEYEQPSIVARAAVVCLSGHPHCRAALGATIRRSRRSRQRLANARGGGRVRNAETVQRFVQIAGGRNAHIVSIDTAALALSRQEFNGAYIEHQKQWIRAVFGIEDVTVLHTFDRNQANSEAFVDPLKHATSVWIWGGSTKTLVKTYVGTRTEQEIEALVARGGIVGGGSAGAMILGSYIVLRDCEAGPECPEGSHNYVIPHADDRGFALVPNVAVDVHISARHSENDLRQLTIARPELLGLGIDETTAVLVHGDGFEVLGEGKVLVWDGKSHGDKPYLVLTRGDKFDLKKRVALK